MAQQQLPRTATRQSLVLRIMLNPNGERLGGAEWRANELNRQAALTAFVSPPRAALAERRAHAFREATNRKRHP